MFVIGAVRLLEPIFPRHCMRKRACVGDDVCLSVCLFPVERVYNLVGGDHGYVRVECECDAKTAKDSGIRWCLFKQQCHVQAQHTVDQEDFCGGEAAQGEVQQRDGGKQSQRSKAQTKPGKGSFAPDSKRQKSVDAHAMPLPAFLSLSPLARSHRSTRREAMLKGEKTFDVL